MSIKKNLPQKKKNLPKIDYPYLLKVLGICMITFILGIFIGKKLTPQDNVKDLKKQIKQTNSQDQFTFFNTLPKQKPTPHSKTKEDPLILTVNNKQEVFLENRKVGLDELEKKVKSIFKYRKEKEVLLKADKEVPYGFVIKVMASVKNAGIEKLGMITEPED